MALSSSSVFEVRSVGSDTNGGGYVTGAGGTDYSQQDVKNTAGNNISTTDGVANGTTTFTSATAAFTTAIVGNIIYLAGGSGGITGVWRQVTARASATSITLDASVAASTGMTLNIGGALATPGAALALLTVGGQTAYVKNTATYTVGTGLTWPAGPSFGSITRMIGYTTTRGDGGRAVIQATAAITLFTTAQNGTAWENFEFDGNSTGTIGASFNTSYGCYLYNVRIHHFTAEAVKTPASSNTVTLFMVEVDHCAGTNGAIDVGSYSYLRSVYAHDNTKPGFYVSGNFAVLTDCIAASNTGASSDGFQLGFGCALNGCVAYANGRDGIFLSLPITGVVQNCILVSNGRYGLNFGLSPIATIPTVDYNAFYNNSSGPRNGVSAAAHDVTLTGVPFTNAAGGDFSLNTTASQGAACRSVGFPGVSLAGTGYADIGALRHQDAGGAATYIFPVFD